MEAMRTEMTVMMIWSCDRKGVGGLSRCMEYRVWEMGDGIERDGDKHGGVLIPYLQFRSWACIYIPPLLKYIRRVSKPAQGET